MFFDYSFFCINRVTVFAPLMVLWMRCLPPFIVMKTAKREKHRYNNIFITGQIWFQGNFDLTQVESQFSLPPSPRTQWKLRSNLCLKKKTFNMKLDLYIVPWTLLKLLHCFAADFVWKFKGEGRKPRLQFSRLKGTESASFTQYSLRNSSLPLGGERKGESCQR